jgi:hypothetical protein
MPRLIDKLHRQVGGYDIITLESPQRVGNIARFSTTFTAPAEPGPERQRKFTGAVENLELQGWKGDR